MTKQLPLFEGGDGFSRYGSVPLTVRESRRARRLTLRMVPPHTLEVVVPRATRPGIVAAFVAEHRRWIERARREIARRYRADDDRLPQRIELAALGRAWSIRYRPAANAGSRLSELGDVLELVSRPPQFAGATAVLRAWLCRQAGLWLKPWLLREAEALGRGPSCVQVRLQRTRWGSCSSAGNISINAALLFLEPPLVRYLFVHELCHLFSLNHSARFWKRVAELEPNYRALDRKLTDAWTLIPRWVHEP
jgi:predicted metal-dependent hydrolase